MQKIIAKLLLVTVLFVSGCTLGKPDSMSLSTNYNYQDWQTSNMGRVDVYGVGLSFTWEFK